MVLFKLGTSASFRGLQKQQEIRRDFLGESGLDPCHNSISNWVLKIGFSALMKSRIIASDWVIILDTSIQMGQEKVLVILGIRQSCIDFSRPLVFKDLVPLVIVVNRHWNGSTVCAEVLKLQESIGSITYAVGDYGGEIRKGLQLAGIRHVHDITHALALLVEKHYKDNPMYKQFCSNLSAMRVRLSQSCVAHIVPPAQRKKSPYQNIRPVTEWAFNSLKFLETQEAKLPEHKRSVEELKWLGDYSGFIQEMEETSCAISKIESELKHHGLSVKTISDCNAILEVVEASPLQPFKSKFIASLKEVMMLMPEHKKILCSSDIIESLFGAYKNFVSHNNMAGVTKLVLVMAALTCNLTQESVKECMENITISQIRDWDKNAIGVTLYQRRRQMTRAA
jgi:hypothetical protein